MLIWDRGHRGDPFCCGVADRHYSRQKIGSSQFVPPGRCLVLKREQDPAVWVTSWPFARYVKHAWAGAWVNSFFRNEGDELSSELIVAAVRETVFHWEIPDEGMISFVCPDRVKPTRRRGADIFGYCYKRAGFRHVGFTKKGLWAWHLDPDALMRLAIDGSVNGG